MSQLQINTTSTKGPVLIVDDETSLRHLMTRWLEAGGYEVEAAATAEEALDLQRQVPAAVALCDIRLPGRDGIWLADQLRKDFPTTAIIMETGAPDVDSAVAGLRMAAVDYLRKPFGREQLCAAVEQGLARHDASLAPRLAPALTRDAGATMQPSSRWVSALDAESAAALDGMLAMLAMRDANAYEHACRVADLALGIAREMRLPVETLGTIERAALLHDVGKMALPDSLLFKPATLNAAELAMVRRFPEIGSEMLKGLWPYLSGTAEIVRAVLEWMDGGGYPRGLRGEAIPLGSRIISVADAFDTMTHPRGFRNTMSAAEAVAELERGSGVQFDATVVAALRVTLGLRTCGGQRSGSLRDGIGGRIDLGLSGSGARIEPA